MRDYELTFDYITPLVTYLENINELKLEPNISPLEVNNIEKEFIENLNEAIKFYSNPPNNIATEKLEKLKNKLNELIVANKLNNGELENIIKNLEQISNEYESYVYTLFSPEENYINYEKIVNFLDLIKTYEISKNTVDISEINTKFTEVIESFKEASDKQKNQYELIKNKIEKIYEEVNQNLKGIDKKRIIVNISVANKSISPNVIGNLSVLRICCDQNEQSIDYKLEVKSIKRTIGKHELIPIQLESKMIKDLRSEDAKNLIKELFFKKDKINNNDYSNPILNSKKDQNTYYVFALGLEDFRGEIWKNKNVKIFQLEKQYEQIKNDLPSSDKLKNQQSKLNN